MKTNQKNSLIPPLGVRGLCTVLLLAFGACSSCKKDVDPISQLPPETQTGANTAGALVNGVAWIPNGNNNTIPTTPAVRGGYLKTNYSSIPEPTKYDVFLSTTASDRKYISFYMRNVKSVGKYELKFDTSPNEFRPLNYGLYSFEDSNYKIQSYITTPQVKYSGFVNVTKADTVNHIVAGTFEFIGYNYVTKDSVKITGGRFDVKN